LRAGQNSLAERDPPDQIEARVGAQIATLKRERRKLTEQLHAQMKNRDFGRMPVHGRGGTGFVCLLHAVGLRRVAAGAT
jgi:hypothetical protein